MVLEDTLQRLKRTRPDCQNCEHRKTNTIAGQYCKKFNAEVPPDVAKVGCDDWSFDDIPF